MIRINLLPVRAEKRKENLRKHVVFITAYLVCLAAVIMSVHLSLMAKEKDAAQRLANVKSQIIEYEQKIKEVEGYKTKFADLAEKIEIISDLEKKQTGPAMVLAEISSVVPDKLWIDKFSQVRDKYSIKGFADENQTIALFMTSLENSKKFNKVKLDLTKRDDKSGVTLKSFSLETFLETPKPPADPNQGKKKAG
jgi:type IV pilus assembly protein PilN